MASKYIVRQPIKDVSGKILGYEILYHGENQAFSAENSSAGDFASADTVYSFLTQNSTKALKGSLNFMTFTTALLMRKTPRLFDRSELVIQIDDSVIIHPLSMRFVDQFAKEGYKIAVNEFEFAPRYLTLMDSIDYIKINNENITPASMRNTIEIAHSMNKKCIVTNINDEESYQRAISLGADALEGTYVAERVTTTVHNSAYLQSSFFQLMVAVTRDEPDVEEIERLISMDASLTFGLLKMANSAYFALRHRATTINQAIMTLGLGQLKQWIYLLSASNMENNDNSDTEEFLKLSFMRANFCSELTKHAKDMPISRSEAYLMGMFSTLNYLVDAPLEEILEEVPVADEIKAALIRREGRCGKLYELVLSYETANWNAITAYAEELGIPNQVITNTYFTCMEDVNFLWDQLNHTSPNQEPEEPETAGAQETESPE